MSLPTTPNKILDEKEKERILQQYMGIFKHQIKEFGEMKRKKTNKPQVNYSR